jgi:isoquinoline 1-oxidoreductase beta subunit
MRGVISVHRLPGAVAVVADHWWDARKAVEAAQVDWQEPATHDGMRYMPADFDSTAFRDGLAKGQGPEDVAEHEGDVAAALASARTRVEAVYHSQYLAHGQLEPPSATAHFRPDGVLELWTPNQAPDMFVADIAGARACRPRRSSCIPRCSAGSSAGTSSTTPPIPFRRRSSWQRRSGVRSS